MTPNAKAVGQEDQLGHVRYDTVARGVGRFRHPETQEWAIVATFEFADGSKQSIPFTLDGAETFAAMLEFEIVASRGANPTRQ